jgi:hypothetical protein
MASKKESAVCRSAGPQYTTPSLVQPSELSRGRLNFLVVAWCVALHR